MARRDRMTARLDTSMRNMAKSLALPPRLADERFRAYHLRVSEIWLATQSQADPVGALSLHRLLDRDARRRAPQRIAPSTRIES